MCSLSLKLAMVGSVPAIRDLCPVKSSTDRRAVMIQ